MIRMSVMYPAGEGKELFADVPNFTNIAPQVQISEIVS